MNVTSALSSETRKELFRRTHEMINNEGYVRAFAFLNGEVRGRTIPHPDEPGIECVIEHAQMEPEGYYIELLCEYGEGYGVLAYL